MTLPDAIRRERTRAEGSGRWLWTLAAVALLAAGGGAYWLLTRPGAPQEAPAPAPPLVRIATAEPARSLVLRQTAFLRPRAEVSVAAEVSGRIAAIGETFELGERVAAGDLLIRLDSESFEADVARAEAGAERAEAALAEAEVARERQARLEEQGYAAEQRLQQALVGVASAEADLAAAEADLTQARRRLADTEVAAPFDALVTAQSAAVGQFLRPGMSVGTLAAADSARLEMGLLPSDIALLGEARSAVGGEVRLFSTAEPRQALGRGTVIDVDPRIERQTRTVGLVVAVPDPFGDGRSRPLRIDELLSVELPVTLPEGAALALPPEALKGRGTLWVVENGALRRVRPEILRREDDRLIVLASGLAAGAAVLLTDLPAAVEGQQVRTAPDAPAPAGPEG